MYFPVHCLGFFVHFSLGNDFFVFCILFEFFFSLQEQQKNFLFLGKSEGDCGRTSLPENKNSQILKIKRNPFSFIFFFRKIEIKRKEPFDGFL